MNFYKVLYMINLIFQTKGSVLSSFDYHSKMYGQHRKVLKT